MNSFKTLRQVACLCVVGVSFLASGCTKSTHRGLPFLRSADNSEPSFSESLAGSDQISLSIWHDSFETAKQASIESGKPILADFTGSDWCGWCIKLKKDVFETAEFKEWARENVILLELDYPKRTAQSATIRKQNEQLAQRYKVQSYPTVLLLDSDGEVLGKLGYMKDPASWIGSATPILSRQNGATQSVARKNGSADLR